MKDWTKLDGGWKFQMICDIINLGSNMKRTKMLKVTLMEDLFLDKSLHKSHIKSRSYKDQVFEVDSQTFQNFVSLFQLYL